LPGLHSYSPTIHIVDWNQFIITHQTTAIPTSSYPKVPLRDDSRLFSRLPRPDISAKILICYAKNFTSHFSTFHFIFNSSPTMYNFVPSDSTTWILNFFKFSLNFNISRPYENLKKFLAYLWKVLKSLYYYVCIIIRSRVVFYYFYKFKFIYYYSSWQ